MRSITVPCFVFLDQFEDWILKSFSALTYFWLSKHCLSLIGKEPSISVEMDGYGSWCQSRRPNPYIYIYLYTNVNGNSWGWAIHINLYIRIYMHAAALPPFPPFIFCMLLPKFPVPSFPVPSSQFPSSQFLSSQLPKLPVPSSPILSVFVTLIRTMHHAWLLPGIAIGVLGLQETRWGVRRPTRQI